MKKGSCLFLCLVFLLFGCNTTIKNFDKYQKAPLLSADFMPSEQELEKTDTFITILPFQVADKRFDFLGQSAVSTISGFITSSKLAKVSDRQNLDKLKDEIILAQSKSSSVSGLKGVDFAISGNISSASSSVQFIEGPVINTAKGPLQLPDRYVSHFVVAGSVSIYKLPDLEVAFSKSFSFDLQKDNQNSDNQDDKAMFVKAFDSGVKSVFTDMKNVFAKSGYISEKRTLNQQEIFKTTLGSSDGMFQNGNVKIFSKRKTKNDLTNKEEIELKEIADAKVADRNEEKSSWIVIKKYYNQNEKIHLGDLVKQYF